MKKRLTLTEIITVASLLFGLFFGAGNIIFPVSLGQAAGAHTFEAVLGFIITAVGLPLLAVIAVGLSRSESVLQMSQKVSRPFSYFFTIALYLTIGPFFATPRLASVSYEVGLSSLIPVQWQTTSLFIYSFLFYSLALFFALRPSGILDWIGKYLNPIFLLLLAVIFLRAFTSGDSLTSDQVLVSNYQHSPLSTGLLEGYNTMDGLAALAFGVIIIQAIQGLGISEPTDIARETIKSGVVSLFAMAIIYGGLAILGTQSLAFSDLAANGGVALSTITRHYFGLFGQILLAVVMAIACLKTAIGLMVALAETFSVLFNYRISKRTWTWVASIISFAVANIGLSQIISYSVPVLMFLYPLAMVLILLHLIEPWFASPALYRWVILFTAIAAFFDLVKHLPQPLFTAIAGEKLVTFAKAVFPFYTIGFGWVLPAVVGLVIGLILTLRHKL